MKTLLILSFFSFTFSQALVWAGSWTPNSAPKGQAPKAAPLDEGHMSLKPQELVDPGLSDVKNKEEESEIYPGSLAFRVCQKELAEDIPWKKYVLTKERESRSWDASWKKPYEAFKEELEGVQDDPNGIAKEVDNYISKLDEIRERLYRCEAYAAITTEVDYEDKDHTHGKQKPVTSFDGKVKCLSDGAETQDYPHCITMLYAYNGAAVATTGMQVYQGIDYQQNSFKLQSDYDHNDPTAALDLQRKDLNKQSEVANIRGGFEAAKLAALGGLLSGMPTRSSLTEQCQANLRQNQGIELVKQKYQKMLMTLQPLQHKAVLAPIWGKVYEKMSSAASKDSATLIKHYCEKIGYGINAIALNSEAVDAIKLAMIASGVQAASNFAKAEILRQQENKVKDVLDDVKKFKPSDLEYTEEDMMVSICQVNPNSPECQEFLSSHGVDFYNGSINVGAGGRASASSFGSSRGADLGDGSSSDSQTSGSSGTFSGAIGGVIEGVDKDTGFETTPPGEATVKSGAGGGQNFGGAGGGAAGGGGGTSGGGSPAPGAEQGPVATSLPGANVGYSGNSSGSLSYGSGRSLKGSKKAKAENPFSDLFGKKGKEEQGEDVLSFRGPASQIGQKGKGLFDMISQRYTQVKDNRLIQYEAVE